MKIMSSIGKVAVVAALFGSVLTGANAESLKVGLIGPMTGPGAPWGFAAKYSMQILADEVNAKGGIEVGGKKYPVEIIVKDSQSNPNRAGEVANDLILKENAIRALKIATE